MLRHLSPTVQQNLIVALVIISLVGNILLTTLIYGGRSRETALLHRVQATQAQAAADRAQLAVTQQAQHEQIHNDIIARCQQANTFRSQDLELWTKVLSVSSTAHPPRTAAEEQAAIDFESFLIKHDALIDCSTL